MTVVAELATKQTKERIISMDSIIYSIRSEDSKFGSER
jgi:hypothetical protein